MTGCICEVPGCIGTCETRRRLELVCNDRPRSDEIHRAIRPRRGETIPYRDPFKFDRPRSEWTHRPLAGDDNCDRVVRDLENLLADGSVNASDVSASHALRRMGEKPDHLNLLNDPPTERTKMKRELLISMFLKMSKENLAEAAADLMLGESEPETENDPQIQYVNNGKRITPEEIDSVLRVAGSLGRLQQSQLEGLAIELGRKPSSIAEILRSNFVPPSEVEASKQADREREPAPSVE